MPFTADLSSFSRGFSCKFMTQLEDTPILDLMDSYPDEVEGLARLRPGILRWLF